MENVFQWYPTGGEFALFSIVALTTILFITLFIVSRKQKPEETTPPNNG